MNIRMLSLAERERFAYIENHPDAELLGGLMDAEQELVDAEQELVEVGEKLRNEENYREEAEEELEKANAKLDELREML